MFATAPDDDQTARDSPHAGYMCPTQSATWTFVKATMQGSILLQLSQEHQEKAISAIEAALGTSLK